MPKNIITGNSGNETLNGTDGDDTITGNGGNDYLKGKAGSDTYIYNAGDGNDDLYDVGLQSDVDVLQFGAGINPGDVTVRLNGSYHLEFELNDGAVVTSTYQYYNATTYGLDKVVFANGTIWDKQTINTFQTTGTVGNETINGTSADETFIGKGGDDYLKGKTGADTYIYNIGDGNDRIYDNGTSADEIDTLRFGAGITAADVTGYLLDGDDYLGLDLTDGSTITVDYQYYSANYGLDAIEFSDGTVWDKAALNLFRTQGNDADNTLPGTASDEVFIGRGGDDYLKGDKGADTYVYESGDGSDRIYDRGTDAATDILQFGAGIHQEDLTFTKDGTQHLDIDLGNDADAIRIEWQYYNANYGVDQFHFTDGTVVEKNDVHTRFQRGDAVDDVLTGTTQSDWLHGEGGNDAINGGAGNDYMEGGSGNDSLTGGLLDADIFHFKENFGHDIIMDFEAGFYGEDIVRINHVHATTFSDVLTLASQIGNDTKIDLDANNSIMLLGVDKNSLHQNDFTFT